jgi:putative ABC transport system permease protein
LIDLRYVIRALKRTAGLRPPVHVDTVLHAAIRSLRQSRAHSAVVVISLTVGIWLVVVTFSVLGARWRRAEMADPDRLVVVMETPSRECTTYCPPEPTRATTFRMWQEARPPSLISLAAYDAAMVELERPSLEDPVLAARVGPDFFSTLGVRAAVGRVMDSDDCRGAADRVAVLSHALWKRVFGGARSAIGSQLVSGGRVYTVIGATPHGFAYPVGAELWLGCDAFETGETPSADRHLMAVARLDPGATINSAKAELQMISDRVGSEGAAEHEPWGVYIQPLEQWVAGQLSPGHSVVVGAIWLAFLVACANVAGLSLVRAIGRQREIAIRHALGARPGQLAVLLVSESLLLAGISCVLGLLLAALTLSRVSSILREQLGFAVDLTLSISVVLATVTLAIGAGLVFGLAPMRHVKRADATILLRSGSHGSTEQRQSRQRKVLLAGEITLVVALCTGALLFVKSYLRALNLDMGFDMDQVVLATPELHGQASGNRSRVTAVELLSRINVASAGNRVALMIPFATRRRNRWDGDRLLEPVVTIAGRDESLADDLLDKQSVPYVFDVSPGFLDVLGFSLLRGRDFTDQDMGTMQEGVIVNETAALRYWPGLDPVGERIKLGPASESGPWYTVIGVASGTKLPHPWGLGLAAVNPGRDWAVIYRPVGNGPVEAGSVGAGTAISVVARKDGLSAGYSAGVRAAFRSAFGSTTVTRIATFRRLMLDASVIRIVRLRAVLLSVFTVVTVLLGLVGIHAMIMEAVHQRTREIGIRITLGAQRTAVLGTVLREAAVVTATGLVGGSALVAMLIVFAGRTIFGFREMLLFGASASDPWVYAGVLLALAVILTIASVAPALRALTVDPVSSLRAE